MPFASSLSSNMTRNGGSPARAIGTHLQGVLQQASAASTSPRRRTKSGTVHRTGAPVRRDSLEAGTFEDTFFAVPADGEMDRLLRAARKALDAGHRLRKTERAGAKLSRSERAVAALTDSAVRVFEEVCTIARLCRGQVFPSYEHLAEATGRSRTTIARALNVLENAGLLIRQRRFKKVEVEGGKSPYRQTSNAYRALLPKVILAHLPRWMRPPPLPVDQVQREAERQEDGQRMLAQLNCRELARATLSGPLADVFAKLGASIDAQSASTEPVLNR